MWNLNDNKGNKVQRHATVTFDVRDFDDNKKTVTGIIDRVLARQCEVAYTNWKGETGFIKVSTRKLTVVKYNDDDDFLGYREMLKPYGKNTFYKAW